MKSDSQLLIQSTLQLYQRALVESVRLIYRSPAIILGAVGLLVGFTITVTIVSMLPLGYAGGFILGFTYAALLSYYYRWLGDTLRDGRLRLTDLAQFNGPLFSSVISVGFIFFIISFGIKIFTGGNPPPLVTLGSGMFFIFFFNPIAESIYIERTDGVGAFSNSAAFIKENWVEWFLPYLVFLSPFFLFGGSPQSVLLEFASTPPFFPVYPLVQIWSSYAISLIGPVTFALPGFISLFIGMGLLIVFTTWFMLFRGLLFRELHGTSRRTRIFRARSR